MLPDKYVLPVIILIIIQILGMIKNIRHKQIDSFFWLCEFSSGLLLIGFLTSNTIN